jgi:chromatin remodeling complex protein RSC6
MASAGKKSTSKKSNHGTDNGRKGARGGLAQEVMPDQVLAAVVGDGPKTRADITKAVWAYVKTNELQDTADRRRINADEKLRPVFAGRDQVTMFEMTRLVNEHVT